MRFVALATDYDGTLARHGTVPPHAIAALERFAATGRTLILVTGRELDELLGVFPEIDRFHRVVAENGALLYTPATGERKPLAEAPPAAFVQTLCSRGVPVSVGSCIVATVEPHETVVLETIRDLGLELQVIFNKGAVMVLPASVNKATGLATALEVLGLSSHNVAAIGDAENDHALLHMAEFSVATGNAIATLRETADHASERSHAEAVIELIDAIIADDLRGAASRSTRRQIFLGEADGGERLHVPPAWINLLIAGTSGSGKSTLATGFLERVCEQGYQFCVIDPEGDYEDFAAGIVFGSADRAPGAEEVLTALEKPDTSAIVNLVALPLQDRPRFFLELLPRLQSLRAKTGRPHWVLVDETHHLMPRDWEPAPLILSPELAGMIYVTVHPEWMAPAVLQSIDIVAALGEAPHETLASVAAAVDNRSASFPALVLEPGEALLWQRAKDSAPVRLRIAPSRTERRRHRRKYAFGELPPDRSFFFRGPHARLNLRAQNLILFLQIADGVDDETWEHHLRAHDYSRWLRELLKDPALGEEVQAIEDDPALSPGESRARVRAAVESHYTMPAAGPGPG
jgi:hydroxymethylpyrimidine pyrophosphatase-like HAD family hydrolase